MTMPHFNIAHIEMNDDVYIYMTRNDDREVFFKIKCLDREDAINFIHSNYPSSDIRTVARFLG